jgi:hypothetical protein
LKARQQQVMRPFIATLRRMAIGTMSQGMDGLGSLTVGLDTIIIRGPGSVLDIGGIVLAADGAGFLTPTFEILITSEEMAFFLVIIILPLRDLTEASNRQRAAPAKRWHFATQLV